MSDPEVSQHNGKLEAEHETDQVLDAIGNWGPWQRKMFFLVGMFLMPGTFHVLVLSFINADQDYWCTPPENMTFSNLDEWLKMSGQEDKSQRCQIYDVDYTKVNRSDWFEMLEEPPSKKPCSAWTYDNSVFTTSVMSEFDLVCEHANLRSIAQTVFFAGMLGGVWGAGVLSDRYGRKTVTIPLLIIMSCLGLASSRMPTFIWFIIMRSLCAMTFVGIMECLFTWLLEMCGGNWSTYVGMGIEFYWVAAWLILALLAYLIREWRLLMTVVSLPGLAGICLIWVMPESPKWLQSTGRLKEAESVVKKIAAYNKRTLPSDWKLELPPHKEGNKESSHGGSFLDIVKHRTLLIKSMILFYNWFVNSFCYYGLALNSHSWGGNVHLSFTINGFLEIPAYALPIFIMVKYGRKYTYALSILATGAILLLTLAIPKGDENWTWALITIGTLGKAAVTFSFAVVYLYTAELYPTVLRTTGMGTSSFMARFGGMASSWVALLASYDPIAPQVTFGMSAFLAGTLALFLPETNKKKLPDTIEESDHFPLGIGCKR